MSRCARRRWPAGGGCWGNMVPIMFLSDTRAATTRELKGRQVYMLGKAPVAGWRRPLLHAGPLDFPGFTINSQM